MNNDRRYYVYLHKSNLNKVFYIGKGTNNRAYDTNTRTEKWKQESSNGYTVEIIKNYLTYSEAEDLEADLLSNPYPEWSLINSAKGRIPSELIEVSRNVYYDETSPTFLRWKFETARGKRKINGIAGSVNKDKYSTLMINGKHYFAHRIVWVLINDKEIPRGYVINHIDCNPSNNNIKNLELITFTENNRRKKCHILENNGVSLSRSRPKNGKEYYSYCGTCTIDGKVVNKYFSIIKYGEEEALRLATEWRKEQIRLLNEQGAGYTERHGT